MKSIKEYWCRAREGSRSPATGRPRDGGEWAGDTPARAFVAEPPHEFLPIRGMRGRSAPEQSEGVLLSPGGERKRAGDEAKERFFFHSFFILNHEVAA